jgi:hypothetical protein
MIWQCRLGAVKKWRIKNWTDCCSRTNGFCNISCYQYKCLCNHLNILISCSDFIKNCGSTIAFIPVVGCLKLYSSWIRIPSKVRDYSWGTAENPVLRPLEWAKHVPCHLHHVQYDRRDGCIPARIIEDSSQLAVVNGYWLHAHHFSYNCMTYLVILKGLCMA